MPDDIKNLFEDQPVVTENDMADYFTPAGEEVPEEFDMDFAEMARANMCGCLEDRE